LRGLGAAEGHAFEPEFQGLPVDAERSRRSGQQRHAQEGAEQGARLQACALPEMAVSSNSPSASS
jgi:hypothetical protein